jgi:hypothetical protein
VAGTEVTLAHPLIDNVVSGNGCQSAEILDDDETALDSEDGTGLPRRHGAVA